MLQAGVVIGSGSASFEMIRHLTDRLPVMTTPKWVHNKIQPIAVHDVLYYLVAAATAPVPSSRTWDIGGPDVLEYGDMMRIYAEVAGLRKRHLIVLPFSDADDCQPVGRHRDPDSRWTGAPAHRIAGMRCGDAQFRHRHHHRAAPGRAHRLPPRGHLGTEPRRARPSCYHLGVVGVAAGRAAAQRPKLGRPDRSHRRADCGDRRPARRRLEGGREHREQQ